MIDYYKIVGVEIDSTSEEIKKAYRNRAFELHPDKNQGDKFYEEKFKDLQAAFSVLSDETSRKEYDNHYRQRLDFLIWKATGTISLPEETFPDYIDGLYLLRLKENNQELARLYSTNKIIDDIIYKSYAFNEFETYWNYRPKSNSWEEDIKYLIEAKTKNILEVMKNPYIFIDNPAGEEFKNLYYQEIIEKSDREYTEEHIIIRCIYLTGKKSVDQHKILILEYLNIIERFSSFLEGKYERNTTCENNSDLAKVLRKISSLIKIRGIKSLRSGAVWNLIISFLGSGKGELDDQLMDHQRKDKPEDKVNNIKTITELAILVTEVEDFSHTNILGFGYVINRVGKYAEGNESVVKSLEPLKNVFLRYIEKLCAISKKNDTLINAYGSIDYLTKNILKSDFILCKKLNKILD